MESFDNLKNLISIRSDENPNEIINFIKGRLKNETEEIIEISNSNDGKKNLIVGINTKLSNVEPIVLSGHIDTVGADEEKYLTNPYNMVIKEGRAYGLGIIDMKCFSACILDLIKKIKSMDIPIVFVLTGDEETTLYGVASVIDEFEKRGIKPKFTIIGEPTSMEIKNIANGCFEYEMEVFGKSCHSSKPEEGINSICVMARLISYIEELANSFDDLTMSCDLIKGGTIINRVPDYAAMSFDIRTINFENYKKAIECIKIKINELEKSYGCTIKIENKLRIPPLSNNNDSIIQNISKCLKAKVSTFLGGCEAGYYKEYSGDAILFGVGDLELAHKPNEYMVIDDFIIYKEKILILLNKLKEIYF